MDRVFLLALLAGVATAPFATAQRMPSRPSHFAGGFAGPGFERMGPRDSLVYPLGLFTDYSDALYRTGYPVASQPPVIILQGGLQGGLQGSAAPEAAKPFGFPAPAQPLMIELQGDRYVRVSGDVNSGAELETVDAEAKLNQRPGITSQGRNISPAVTAAAAAEELPSAVLVFRDGHREEVAEYTIADGALYAQGDYYTSGSFTRKIELKSLDLSETVKSNRSRGVAFRVPASPNEVIVRP
jgi:hypothetical protein